MNSSDWTMNFIDGTMNSSDWAMNFIDGTITFIDGTIFPSLSRKS